MDLLAGKPRCRSSLLWYSRLGYLNGDRHGRSQPRLAPALRRIHLLVAGLPRPRFPARRPVRGLPLRPAYQCVMCCRKPCRSFRIGAGLFQLVRFEYLSKTAYVPPITIPYIETITSEKALAPKPALVLMAK